MSSESYSGPATKQAAFTNPSTHPLVLNLLMLGEFGPDYIGWEPETCWAEVQMTFGSIPAEVNRQKIQAMRAVYCSAELATEWEVFEKVAAGLGGVIPRLDLQQRPSPVRAHLTLEVLEFVHDAKFTQEEVYRYCAAVLMDHGLVYGPGKLEPANQYIVGVDRDFQHRVRECVLRSGQLTTRDAFATQVAKSRDVVAGVMRLQSDLSAQLQQLSL